MATNHTTNYALNLWEPTDAFLREEFNENTQKIDAALAAHENRLNAKADASAVTAALSGYAKIAIGSYSGSGNHGKNNKNYLTFPFQPKIVFIAKKESASSSSYTMMIRGQSMYCNFNSSGGGSSGVCTWSGNTLTWYSDSDPTNQMSLTGEYFYAAIG